MTKAIVVVLVIGLVLAYVARRARTTRARGIGAFRQPPESQQPPESE
jgi:hypothetical protein